MTDTQKTDEAKSSGGVDARLTTHGGLSYLEIPPVDTRQSATFYEKVCGWNIEQREGNDFCFAEPTGSLIGRWVDGRVSSREPGLLPYIYVDHIQDAVNEVAKYGAQVIKAPYVEGNLLVATIRDPAGNVIGRWQEVPR